MYRWFTYIFGMLLLAINASACGGTPTGNLASATADADKGQLAGCSYASDPSNLFIAEWPAVEKTNFEVKSKNGLVVVSYAKCHLTVLQGCSAPGEYVNQSGTLNADTFDITSEGELLARLPLGAASLAADLASQGALYFSYASVGQRLAAKAPVQLDGECRGATHYVRAVTTGAFKIGSSRRTSASVNSLVAGGSVATAEYRDRLGGNLDECLRTNGATGCNAILQIGLAELNLGTQEAGFGAGLGPLASVPSVAVHLGAVPDVLFKDADVAWLKLVQAAKRADRDPAVSSKEKIAAWRSLAAYHGTNPLRDEAMRRTTAWENYQRKAEERARQIAAAYARYEQDAAKLKELLALDDEVISTIQKRAYQQEFDRVYLPWRRAFDQSGVGAQRRGVSAPVPRDWIIFEGGEFRFQGEKEMWLKPFALSRTEVTVAEYKLCVEAGSCSEPDTGDLCNYHRSNFDLHPVNCVDWTQARAYAKWARARLPSEAEWEFAATNGGQPGRYPWGDNVADCSRAVMFDFKKGAGCGAIHTSAVCSNHLGNTTLGVCDLAGNVWEWVEDAFVSSLESLPADGTPYTGSSHKRGIRGGSFANGVSGGAGAALSLLGPSVTWGPNYLSSRDREREQPDEQSPLIGFRVARSM